MVMNTTLGTSGSSSATPTHAWYAERSTEEAAILAFFLGVIGILAFVGNVIVIACVRVYHRLRREVGSYFIVNLCLADMMTSMVVMSSSSYSVMAGVRTVHKPYCQFVCCMNYTLIIVSMLTLGFIAVDRFLAVVYALRYHVFMKKRIATLLIGWSWVQGLCFGLAPVFEDWIHYDYGEIVCAIRWVGRGPLIYVIIAFVVCFLIPGGVLVTLYCKVMSVASLHQQNDQVRLGSLAPEDSASRRSTTKAPALNLDVTHASNDPGNAIASDLQIMPEATMNHDPQIDQAGHTFPNSSRAYEPNSLDVMHFAYQQHVANTNNASRTTLLPTLLCKNKKANSTIGSRRVTADLNNTLHNKSNNASRYTPYSYNTPDTMITNFFSSTPILKNFSSPKTSTLIKRSESLPVINLLPSVGYNESSSAVSRVTKPYQRQHQSLTIDSEAALTTPRHCAKETSTSVGYSASRKALRSLLIVVLAFFVCMTPFSVTKLYKVIMSDSQALPSYVNIVSTLAQYCSSAINPLIYGVLRKDFQHAFKILINRFKRMRQSDFPSHSLSNW